MNRLQMLEDERKGLGRATDQDGRLLGFLWHFRAGKQFSLGLPRRMTLPIPLPVVRHFRGFKPDSQTLVGPATTVGNCMGDFMPEGSLNWYDAGVRPCRGDVVLIEVPRPLGGPPAFYSKIIEQIDGKLWGLSEDVPLPIVSGMKIIGPLVASVTLPGRARVTPTQRDLVLCTALLRKAAPMLSRVVRFGFDKP
jgi:hypothetical protein